MTIHTSYNPGDFSWVDLVAHDMDAAREFYCNLFDWTSVDMNTQGGSPYAQFMRAEHVVAGIGQMSDEMKAQGIPPMWNSYIHVDDAEAVSKRAAELGATIAVPAMRILDYGSIAFLEDPTGGHVGLWQPGTHLGAQVTRDPGSLCWNELATRDADQAKHFYGQLFGWAYENNPSAPTAYDIIKNQGQNNGGIMQMNEAWGDMPTHWNVYFSVADVEASVERLQELGGTVHEPPFDAPPAGRIAVVADLQGAVLHLIQLTPA